MKNNTQAITVETASIESATHKIESATRGGEMLNYLRLESEMDGNLPEIFLSMWLLFKHSRQ